MFTAHAAPHCSRQFRSDDLGEVRAFMGNKDGANARVVHVGWPLGYAMYQIRAHYTNLGGSESAVSQMVRGAVPVSVGPMGGGQGANLAAERESYSRAKSTAMGMSAESSVLDVRATLNQAYFGKDRTPIDVVSKRSVTNNHEAGLRKSVAAASK